MTDMSFDEMMAESFRDDPAYAVELLNQLLEDGDTRGLLMALRQMAQAFGGMKPIAEQANLNVNSLYRALSAQGNPQVSTLSAVLRTMGLRLAVQPMATVAA